MRTKEEELKPLDTWDKVGERLSQQRGQPVQGDGSTVQCSTFKLCCGLFCIADKDSVWWNRMHLQEQQSCSLGGGQKPGNAKPPV